MTKPQHAPDLSQILCARMCHDLVSPIGAIRNGLELLQLTGQADTPEMELIQQSVEDAAARIALFRLAFGNYNLEDQTAPDDAQRILAESLADMRLKVIWSVTRVIPRAEAKLSILLSLCAKTCLPWGGRIEVTDAPLTVQAVGKTKMDAEIWSLLQPGSTRDCRPRDVHFVLARDLAQDLGGEVYVTRTDDGVALTFRR